MWDFRSFNNSPRAISTPRGCGRALWARQPLLHSGSPWVGAGWAFCLLYWLRWSVYFKIKFKYCRDKQHDLFNVSLKRKWHSRTKERPRAKLDSLSQSKNGSELGSPKNHSPKAASSDGYNHWINKTKTQHPWSFPHISRLCRRKSPFLYPLPLSINMKTYRHVHRGPPLGGHHGHTHQREEKSLLRRGPKKRYDVDPTAFRERFTYGFRLIWGLNLFAFKFLPVNIPEKCVLFDVAFTFRSTTQTFAWVFGHQLQEKEKCRMNFRRGNVGLSEMIAPMNEGRQRKEDSQLNLYFWLFIPAVISQPGLSNRRTQQ